MLILREANPASQGSEINLSPPWSQLPLAGSEFFKRPRTVPRTSGQEVNSLPRHPTPSIGEAQTPFPELGVQLVYK
jgi:hypothetical protein